MGCGLRKEFGPGSFGPRSVGVEGNLGRIKRGEVWADGDKWSIDLR